jgi:hypothetical protein
LLATKVSGARDLINPSLSEPLTNRQLQAWNGEFLIHTRDLTKILANCGASTVNFSIASGKIIPSITVRIRCAENLSAEKGTGWKLKDMIVSE